MRKLISVTVALMMVAAMLSSGALAENGKEHKGGTGAGKEQKQSQAAVNEDKGNSHGPEHTPAVHILDKSTADDTVITVDDDNDDENEVAGDENGDADETTGHVKNINENKPGEKTQDGPNHGNAYGRVRNIQAVLDDIGQLAGEESAVQLNTLLSTYREAKDTETAKTALTALLDALTQACTVDATDENVEGTDTQDQLALENLAKLREKVLANAGNDNGTLLALMHAYEDALRIMNHLEPIDDPDEGTETDGDTGSVLVPII